MRSSTQDFRQAVRALHRAKDAAYGDAWKKRGEVLSVLANIARKVDRLEYVFKGAPTTRDESLLDTAIDLFVYCLKYQTFLADLNASVANTLFGRSGLSGSYTEGPMGFEYLLDHVDLAELDVGSLTTAEAVSLVLTRFGELESCFSGVSTSCSVIVRSDRVRCLIEPTVILIAALKREDSSFYRDFVSSTGGIAI